MPGEIEYASSAGRSVAYRVFGSGPMDVVVVQPFMSTMRHLRASMGDVLERMGRFSRFVIFDRRGSGISDPLPLDNLPTLEDWSGDIVAVMDAVGMERAVLVGFLGGGTFAMCVAGSRPDRVPNLVVMHSHATYARSEDYPWGGTSEERDRQIAYIESGWEDVDEDWLSRFGGHLDADSYRRAMRAMGSPAQTAAFMRRQDRFDVRPYLPFIKARTLILHRRDNRFISIEVARYLAEQIADATLVAMPGDAHQPMMDTTGIADEIEEFLTGSRAGADPQRMVAAVLFTDIVESTDAKSRTGDKRWRDLLSDHNRIVRRHLQRHGGREVNTVGDGFLVTFDAPVRAILCAQAMIEDVVRTGLRIRAGIHAGEIERLRDDITGITVDIGARVTALAGPNEILVSSTVRDMAIGSTISFEERGEHELKGVPGRWRIYAVTP
jgi:class 3 adenylate cyclase